MKIELGSKVRDIVSGFTGIVTGCTRFLTGCDRYGVQPEAIIKTDNSLDLPETKVFDGPMLEVLEGLNPKLRQALALPESSENFIHDITGINVVEEDTPDETLPG